MLSLASTTINFTSVNFFLRFDTLCRKIKWPLIKSESNQVENYTKYKLRCTEIQKAAPKLLFASF